MSQREYNLRMRLKEDFPSFSLNCLKIVPKEVPQNSNAGLIPFVLNRTQLYLNNSIEEQIRTRGYAKTLCVKARQEGITSMATGRYLWKAIHIPGTRVFILTHKGDATKNVFGMTQRFYNNLPEQFKPVVDKNNSKELSFPLLNSGYAVGTAGSGDVGRSYTINFFHGSEVAFWENAQDIASGIMQSIPKKSEILLESTACGKGNYFHDMWVKAVNKESDYVPVFIPWFWMKEYSEIADDSLIINEEERDIRNLYNLTNNQMMWRQKKIAEIGLKIFKQEYPCNAEEAFSATSDLSFIPGYLVEKARKATVEKYGSIIIGVDPARSDHEDRNRTAIICRQTRVAFDLRVFRTGDTMKIVGILIEMINTYNPAAVCIDVIGIGAGIVDRLRELGYERIIHPVVAGATPYNSKKYRNKKAECWGEMLEWLQDFPCQIPDSEELHIDLCSLMGSNENSNRLLEMESGNSLRKRMGANYSPDTACALSHTFGVKLNTNTSSFPVYKSFRL